MNPASPVLPSNPQSQQHEVVLGKDQPEYIPLPVVVISNAQGEVIQHWRLSWRERLRILLSGSIWVSQWTFGSRLQPVRLTAFEPFSQAEQKEIQRQQ